MSNSIKNKTVKEFRKLSRVEYNALDDKEKKEYKKLKRQYNRKSHIAKILEVYRGEKKGNIAFIVSLFLAFLLDLLKVLGFILIGLLLTVIIVILYMVISTYIKVKPYYDKYTEYAEEIVGRSTNEDFDIDASTFIYDKDGQLIAKVRGDADSIYLSYEQIPQDAIDAFVAVEDRSFWDNSGIDLKGIGAAIYGAVKSKGDDVRGASTITQQLVRNIYLSHEVSIDRKLKEMFIAMQLNKKYTKEQIMTFYVNDICFANAIYGLEAAAENYFGKKAEDLTLSQIAYLCAIPNSPEYYNPRKHPERALERRDKILNDMLELGYIEQDEYDKAINEEIVLTDPKTICRDYQTTFAVECVIKYFMRLNGFTFEYEFSDQAYLDEYNERYKEAYEIARNKVYSGGYKVYTSLDSDVQEEMQAVIDDHLSFDTDVDETTGLYELQGAMTVFDNETGKVIAVVGGRSQEELDTDVYSFNRAYQGVRQPGSTIKPLVVYTPAIENGYKPDTKVYNIDVDAAKEKGVDVQALRGTSMTLRSALEQSKNGVAWQIFDKIGARNAMNYLSEMEYSHIVPDDYYNSSSLGGLTNGVTTVEMAGGYGTLVNHGVFRQPTCIESIVDKQGSNIYVDEPSKEVYYSWAADTIVDMMKGVLTNGTAAKLGWYGSTDMVAACKTGTTNDSKDGWLNGFTPYYTISVWVGYDQPKTLSNLYGATYPGQIWKDAMLRLIADKPVKTEFDESSEYAEYKSDKILRDHTDGDTDEFSWLEGRDDDEELAAGYTVRQYKEDYTIVNKVTQLANKMRSLNIFDINSQYERQKIYAEGCGLISQIYGNNARSKAQSALDTAFYSIY